MLTAAKIGISEDEFWGLGFDEWFRRVEAWEWNQAQTLQLTKIGSWLTALYTKQRRLPTLQQVLRTREQLVLTPAQLAARRAEHARLVAELELKEAQRAKEPTSERRVPRQSR